MRIHHVGYLTKRLSGSEAAFIALGYHVEQEASFDPIRKARLSFLRNENYRVELIEPSGKESPLYPLLKHYKNTPYHFCYVVDNLEAACEKLAGAGYAVIQEPNVVPCLGGRKVEFIMSADAGMIELLEDIHLSEYKTDEIVPLNPPVVV
jgi:methylmalonyl-CoA/ethylmalonyl-CoA epimerase